jgi:hypothetical protein
MKHPTAEEFATWKDHPVTRWVLSACAKTAAENREHWSNAAWNTGDAHQALLTENRTRADAYMALAQTEYEGWVETHEQ